MTESIKKAHLRCEHLSLSYEHNCIIEDLSIEIADKEITVILGANGSGKSTLLKGLAGLLTPVAGKVWLGEDNIHTLPRKKLAQKMAILTQSAQVNEEMIVKDLIALGRHPYHRLLRPLSQKDKQAITNAMQSTNLLELADRRIATLSGGQQQRVWIAMALAQETPWLCLDEPTTYLDLNHQISILNLLQSFNKDNGLSLVMVLHDINLACRYADNIILIKEGALCAQGAPQDIINAHSMRETFNLACDVIDDPISHTPLCIPHLNTTKP